MMICLVMVVMTILTYDRSDDGFFKALEDGPHHRHTSSPSPPSSDHVSIQHYKRKSPRQSNMMIVKILLH